MRTKEEERKREEEEREGGWKEVFAWVGVAAGGKMAAAGRQIRLYPEKRLWAPRVVAESITQRGYSVLGRDTKALALSQRHASFGTPLPRHQPPPLCHLNQPLTIPFTPSPIPSHKEPAGTLYLATINLRLATHINLSSAAKQLNTPMAGTHRVLLKRTWVDGFRSPPTVSTFSLRGGR